MVYLFFCLEIQNAVLGPHFTFFFLSKCKIKHFILGVLVWWFFLRISWRVPRYRLPGMECCQWPNCHCFDLVWGHTYKFDSSQEANMMLCREIWPIIEIISKQLQRSAIWYYFTSRRYNFWKYWCKLINSSVHETFFFSIFSRENIVWEFITPTLSIKANLANFLSTVA